MKIQSTLTGLALLILLFIMFGDRIPYQPVSSASLQTRTTLNNFLMGVFANKKTKNPYERTEKAIQQEEQGAGVQSKP